ANSSEAAIRPSVDSPARSAAARPVKPTPAERPSSAYPLYPITSLSAVSPATAPETASAVTMLRPRGTPHASATDGDAPTAARLRPKTVRRATTTQTTTITTATTIATLTAEP